MSRKTGRPPILDARLKSFVWEIYRRRLATQKELAKFLGVSQPTIHRIVVQS
jgi:DNA-binding MarR family transcriptional regulator